MVSVWYICAHAFTITVVIRRERRDGTDKVKNAGLHTTLVRSIALQIIGTEWGEDDNTWSCVPMLKMAIISHSSLTG